MKTKKMDLERKLDNQCIDLLQQQLFTGSNVPANLVGMVRSFQAACLASGVEDTLNLHQSVIERCEIQIGAIHLDLTAFDEEKVRKALAENAIMEKEAEGRNEQIAGQIAWQFTGVNQFGSVTIRVKERTWQVEFSRLQRCISAYITDEKVLKPQAHQALYEEMKKMLQPLAASEPSQLLILQGAPGLGKSHCTEHYFYHEAPQHHQMVAWLSGKSKEAFLRDWQALANQLRNVDYQRKDDSDTALICHWCEEQLGQWLLIVDDAQLELDWLKQYLPQKGGHVLITTAQACFNLPQSAKILSFAPLSAEDSKLLLKAGLGKEWEATGHPEEVQALEYLSEALSGSPALLTQIALLVRKKGLSFARVKAQFHCSETRCLLLADTVFNQLKDQTFLSYISKSWQQWVNALSKYYPQFTAEQHEVHLKEFIDFLKQHVAPALAKAPKAYIEEEVIIAYWQRTWTALAWTPLNTEQLKACLNLLPLADDNINHRWTVTLVALDALAQVSARDLSLTALSQVTARGPVQKAQSDLPQVPAGVNLSVNLENSRLAHAEIALLTTGKPADLTTWRLPTSNPYFIPRPALITEIAQKLPHKNVGEKSAELVLAAASGMGGIGKTELARHFITTPELSAHYKKRFWFNAASAEALRNEFYDLASGLGLIEPKQYLEDQALIQRLHRWFNLNPGWLLVLDNADEYNSIAQWVPKEGGSVLITTREPNPGTLKDEQIIKVPLLELKEAIDWLYRLAQRDPDTATELEKQAARRLVENLGYLPLAIAQAAAYLREQSAVSIEAYQQNFLALLLQDKNLIQEDKTIAKNSDAYSRCVIASTWKLSLQRIEASAKEKGLFNACPWLLAACSHLAPKDIPLGLLEYWFKGFCNLEGISPQLLSYLLDEYTAQLLRYSLCERDGSTDKISVHRLVQEVLRPSLTHDLPLQLRQASLPAEIMYWDERKGFTINNVFLSLTAALFNYSAEFAPSIADRKRRIDLLSHLQVMVATWEALNHQDEVNSETLINFYGRLAEIQLALRVDSREGLRLCQRELDLCQKYYGPEHPEAAITLANLGIAYGALGDAQQQKSLLERALHIKEQHYGPEHPEVSTALMSLGNAYGALGNFNEQKNLLERALRIKERYDGPEHPQVATILMNLGNAYGFLGDAQQRKILLERALRIEENYYGPEYPSVALTLMNLGNAYGDLGDIHQQKRLLEKALRIEELHYGSEHPWVATTLMSLGNVYGDLGDIHQQKRLLERALHILEQHYGPESPAITTALMSLGNTYNDLGKAQQQKQLLERALRIDERYYGSEHPEVATILANLGISYSVLGDVEQGKIFLEKALRILEQHYGPESVQVASSLMNLANAYGVLGEIEQKKSLQEKALFIFEKHYGPEHPEVAKALTSLSSTYDDLGEIEQQNNLLKRALPLFEKHYGSEHPKVATVLATLGISYGILGDIRQEKILLERALPLLEQHYGPESLQVASSLMNLANAYGFLGEVEQKKILQERALPIFEQRYGPEHPEVIKALTSLSKTYSDLGDTELQKNLLEKALPLFEKHYGSDHLEVATVLANLGTSYGVLGDVERGKIFLERALPILERHCGPESLQVASNFMNLATFYGRLGDFQQKKSLQEKALLIFEKHYGSEHPEVGRVLASLSRTYGDLGDVKQQKNLLEKTLTLIEKYCAPEHPEVIKTLTRLIAAYNALGDTQQGKKLLEKALEQYTEPTLLKRLGDELLCSQQLFEAIRCYEKALEIDPQCPDIHHNLACCYHACGDISKADACFQKGVTLFATSAILAEYSHFLVKQGRFQEPLTFIERCLKAVNDDELGYGVAECPTILPAIQNLVKQRPSQLLGLSAQGLAHYLQVLCYQTSQQENQAQKAMKQFEWWIERQPDPEQQEIFHSLKNSLACEAEKLALNLLSLQQQLFQAVAAGDLKFVQAVIEKQDFSINHQEKDSQRTALHLACISQQTDIVAYLLAKLAHFDVKDKAGKFAWEYVINTPLLELFNTTSTIYAQKYSAALNAGIFLDWGKVLRMAVANNYLADVRFLIEVKGIDVNSVDANPKTRYTALHLAVIRNKPEIAQYLISKGADIKALDASQKTPLNYIKPEQEALMALFKLSLSAEPLEDCRSKFEKCHL